ncbi:MAG TPA: LysR family transcriptional regulator [Candidatus Lachnoclostridium avicola]|nr:LysR family transcriptional regulator [Candidatus Lachnoclostridium avicola]
MNLREWEYILMIAQEKSISKAAEKLYMTQPALSIFLSRLEASLGTELFRRESGGLSLTYAGERYVDIARQMVSLNRKFQQELCEINEERLGRIHIGTSAHIGSIVLPEVIPAFNEKYPNIEVAITEGSSRMLEDMISRGELDAALMHLPFQNLTGADYVEIKKDRYVMAFSKNHPLTSRVYEKTGEKYPFIDPREAAGKRFILSFPYQRVRQISDMILQKAGIVPDIRVTTSSVQTALRLAGAGLGVTFLPESYIQLFRWVREPCFCYMEEEWGAWWTFVIARPGKVPASGPVKEFIRIAEDIFKSET